MSRPNPTDVARAHRKRSRRVARSSAAETTEPYPEAELSFRDTATGEHGVIVQRGGDQVFVFEPDDGSQPRGVYEPGRYVRA